MSRLLDTAKAFEKRGAVVRTFSTAEEAKVAFLESVDITKKVAFGGSMTLQNMGLYEALVERGSEVLWHWKVSSEYAGQMRADAMKADVYATSSNALIEDGRLLNIDGVGNRVAAMFYGPPRVIVIAGKNKLAPDYDSALDRIKTIACPKNAERLNREVPCRHTGKCSDCRSPHRMCRVTVLIEPPLDASSLEVWLIDEDCGY